MSSQSVFNTTRATRMNRESTKYHKSVSFNCGLTAGNTTREIKTFHIIALIEGCGNMRGEIGLACMDALCSYLCIYQFLDSASYARLRMQIQILEPVEVIVPEMVMAGSSNINAIIELIRSNFPNVELTMLNRRYFNYEKGKELVKQLNSAEMSNVMDEIYDKFYCMVAASAVIQYVEFIQNIFFAQSSLRVIYQSTENSCFIDVGTMRSIEMIERDCDGKRSGISLYAMLNTCQTGGGVRMIRSNLLQPSANKTVINARLDTVEELLSDTPRLKNLRQIISRASDIQHLVTLCCYLNHDNETYRVAELRISHILSLQKSLMLIPPLKLALDNSRSQLLQVCLKQLNDKRFAQISNLIEEIINPDILRVEKSASALLYRRCFAVRSGLDSMIDVARKAFQELVQDLEEKSEEDRKDMPEAKLIYTCLDRISNAVNEIMIRSNTIVVELLKKIRTLIPCLYQLIEVISLIDFITCLATYALRSETVRPVFSAANSIVIKNGRHPLLELSAKDVIRNDTYLSPEMRMAIVTGPNMAGKSTYLKQICLLQVLAQTGSFVPAEFAAFSIITRIFSRMGHNDDLNSNLSSFAVEMSEMIPVLANANSTSLVVIDELARSTSAEEGLAICCAICEELIKTEAFTLFATHYLQLSLLACNYAVVENYHFSGSSEENGTVEAPVEISAISHRLYRGPYNGAIYGLNIAEISEFPKEVLITASAMVEKLLAKGRCMEFDDEKRKKKAAIRLIAKLRSILPVLKESNQEQTAAYLTNLREKFFADI